MRRIVVVFTILSTAPLVQCAMETRGRWKSVEVLALDGLGVRLLYRSRAALSDEEWMRLEFSNRGDQPIPIGNVNYRIESKRFTPDGNTPIASGGLASGNTHDLFPLAWETTPVWDIVLSPGTVYTVAEHPSRSSSALLGLSPEDGLLVKATLYLSLQSEGGGRRSSPTEGIPFSFQWQYPDANGFLHMQQRLNSLLQEPESEAYHCHAYILGVLLGIPEVSCHLSHNDVFAAIDRRSGGFDGREELVKYLQRNDFDRQQIVDFYLSRLRNMDTRVCRDLRRSHAVWDVAFIEPLVIMHETDRRSPPFRALSVLAGHDDDWKNDRAITHRLSAVLLERYGKFLTQTPGELIQAKGLERWASRARDLSSTRDIDVLPLLVPLLDCKEHVLDPRWADANRLGDLPKPYRACDVALEAILRILDGDTRPYASVMP